MKSFKVMILLILLAFPILAAKLNNGEDLISEMHKRYAAKWYQTITFVQKTTIFKPDGTKQVSTWYEAMNAPGKLRIDFAPLEKGDGILFVDGMLHSFRDGNLARSQPYVHPLLVLGFDVYRQSAEKTIGQLKELKIDLSVLHEEMWQGKLAYAVGAKQGDLRSPQFWIDKKNLYFVRLLEPVGKDKTNLQEVQFNKYQKVKGGGWISPEVLVFVDGKPTQTEEYTEIQAGVSLDGKLFETTNWMTADRTYFQKKK